MPRLSMILISCVVLSAAPLQAACFADYKAKQDNPLKLHYGVIELGDALCDDLAGARTQIAQRIGRDGWQLLSVMGIFDADAADRKRGDAGPFFLRY